MKPSCPYPISMRHTNRRLPFSLLFYTQHIRFHFLCVFFLFSLPIYAQQTSAFSVSPTQVSVGEGESFGLTYTLANEGIKNFQAPSFAGFDIVGGPNKSTSMQIINGHMSSSTAISYYLSPKKAGQYTIPAATVTTDKGNNLRSGKVSVAVSKGSGNANNNRRQQQPPAQQPPAFPFGFPPFGRTPQAMPPNAGTNSNTQTEVFMRVVIDTPQVYKGQQLTAAYRIYTNTDIADYSISTAPAFTGFWVEDLEKKTATRSHEEKINGKTYTAYNIKQYALFPQQAGQLQVDAIDITVEVQTPDPQFGGLFYQTRTLKLRSDSATVRVNELPADNRPADFSGAVGRLQLSANMPQGTAKTGEPIALEVIVSGEGNIKLLQQPTLDLPPSFEKYDPKTSEETFVEGKKINGRRIFEYTITPTKTGDFTLPPVTYTYFDLDTKQYKTLSSQPITVHVTQGKNEYTPQQADNNLKDIDPPLYLYPKKQKWFFASPLYIALWLLPLSVLGIAFWQKRKKASAAISDPTTLKQMEAKQTAQKRLQTAQILLAQNDVKPFYNEIIHALHTYLTDKFNLKAGALNEEYIKITLLKNGIDTNNTQQLLAILRHCQTALYAPATANTNTYNNPYGNAPTAQQIYQQADTLLSAIDGQLAGREKKLTQRQNAANELHTDFQKIQTLLDNNELPAFYDGLSLALWSYVGNKFGIEPNGMRIETIKNALDKSGVSASTNIEFIELLEYCHNLILTPPITYMPADAQHAFAQAKDILRQIENEAAF